MGSKISRFCNLSKGDFGLQFASEIICYGTSGEEGCNSPKEELFPFLRITKILDKVKYPEYHSYMKQQEMIDEIRAFNRFYTNVIGLLDQHFLDSPFSLTEGRVLYEIYTTGECSAKEIRESILIDEGYLSRILDNFVKQGLIRKTRSPEDGRLWLILPTERGKREFASLNQSSNRLISQLIETLSEEERADLLNKMEGIRTLLEKAA